VLLVCDVGGGTTVDLLFNIVYLWLLIENF
jgi:hypothetical protein